MNKCTNCNETFFVSILRFNTSSRPIESTKEITYCPFCGKEIERDDD